ncbi:MAG: GntR family transcriptional regulator [Clostridiaceae bacterium]|nr:GntR family transcriptional regulator [Clostridiaceae bacterium]
MKKIAEPRGNMEYKYLYQNIYNSLKQEIISGTYESGCFLPTERELCQRFSVERTTVRRALDFLVKDRMVEKYPGMGSKVIYSKKQEETRIVSRGGDSIGIFMVEKSGSDKRLTEPYYSDLFYYLAQECYERGLQLVSYPIHENTNIEEIIRRNNFLTAVFVTKVPKNMIRRAAACRIPVLLVNELYENFSTIQHDYFSCATTAMQYLYDNGHRRIAVLRGPDGYLATRDELAGVYDSIIRLKLKMYRDWIVEGDWTMQSGYNKTKELFTSCPKLPTAVFACNDIMAIGAIHALRDLGLSIPGDVSIIGMNNMEQLQFLEPDLTTIDGSTSHFAKVITELAYKNALVQNHMGVKIVMPVKLIVRGTVTPLVQKKEEPAEAERRME